MIKLSLIKGRSDKEAKRLENLLPESFARLADFYLNRGEYQKALKILEEYYQSFPKYPTGYLLLGEVCLKLEQKEKALGYLQRVLQLIPEHPAALELIGRIYMENGEEAIARSYFNQVRQIDKLYGVEFNTKSGSPKTEPKPSVTTKTNQEAVETLQNSFATETMVNLYIRQGHKKMARELCEKILVSQPDNRRIQSILEELEK